MTTSPAAPEYVNIKIRYEGTVVMFKVRPSVAFAKVSSAFCEKTKLDKASVRFLFESARIGETQTFEELGVQDGDELDAYISQSGG